jgi:hypothetical protein
MSERASVMFNQWTPSTFNGEVPRARPSAPASSGWLVRSRLNRGKFARKNMSTERASPADENREVLRRMASDGIDLTSRRVIDFEHCFPDEGSARAFHAAIAQTVHEVRLLPPNADYREGWEVQCRVILVPTQAGITDTELTLGSLAQTFGGYPDGWGFMSNPDGSPAD